MRVWLSITLILIVSPFVYIVSDTMDSLINVLACSLPAALVIAGGLFLHYKMERYKLDHAFRMAKLEKHPDCTDSWP